MPTSLSLFLFSFFLGLSLSPWLVEASTKTTRGPFIEESLLLWPRVGNMAWYGINSESTHEPTLQVEPSSLGGSSYSLSLSDVSQEQVENHWGTRFPDSVEWLSLRVETVRQTTNNNNHISSPSKSIVNVEFQLSLPTTISSSLHHSRPTPLVEEQICRFLSHNVNQTMKGGRAIQLEECLESATRSDGVFASVSTDAPFVPSFVHGELFHTLSPSLSPTSSSLPSSSSPSLSLPSFFFRFHVETETRSWIPHIGDEVFTPLQQTATKVTESMDRTVSFHFHREKKGDVSRQEKESGESGGGEEEEGEDEDEGREKEFESFTWTYTEVCLHSERHSAHQPYTLTLENVLKNEILSGFGFAQSSLTLTNSTCSSQRCARYSDVHEGEMLIFTQQETTRQFFITESMALPVKLTKRYKEMLKKMNVREMSSLREVERDETRIGSVKEREKEKGREEGEGEKVEVSEGERSKHGENGHFCPSVSSSSQPSVRYERQVENRGFHKTLITTLQLTDSGPLPPLSSLSSSSSPSLPSSSSLSPHYCNVSVWDILPFGVYVDRDELSHLQYVSSHTFFHLDQHVDVEKPAEKSPQVLIGHTQRVPSSLLLSGQPFSLSLPIHLRYRSPSLSPSFSKSDYLLPPFIFVSCDGSSSSSSFHLVDIDVYVSNPVLTVSRPVGDLNGSFFSSPLSLSLSLSPSLSLSLSLPPSLQLPIYISLPLSYPLFLSLSLSNYFFLSLPLLFSLPLPYHPLPCTICVLTFSSSLSSLSPILSFFLSLSPPYRPQHGSNHHVACLFYRVCGRCLFLLPLLSLHHHLPKAPYSIDTR